MARKPKNTFLQEVQERADHNINPHYWFNRIDHRFFAELRASLAMSQFETAMIGIVLLFFLVAAVIERNIDYLLPLVIFLPFFLLSLVRTVRWYQIKNQPISDPEEHSRPKERKKRLPKRRKDFR